jgi:chemotaxis protein CheD
MSLDRWLEQKNDKGRNTVRGFEHVNRYFDPTRRRMAAKILPGEYYVTRSDEFILTTLGSCVSACIWDEAGGVGGMNHFMLPTHGLDHERHAEIAKATEAARYGTYAMEHLINEILKHGGSRDRLQIKIVGGGKVLRADTDIGARNIEFVRDYIKNEGLRIKGEHVGGLWPRKVCFHPLTGAAKVKELMNTANSTILVRETRYAREIDRQPAGGEVELF